MALPMRFLLYFCDTPALHFRLLVPPVHVMWQRVFWVTGTKHDLVRVRVISKFISAGIRHLN